MDYRVASVLVSVCGFPLFPLPSRGAADGGAKPTVSGALYASDRDHIWNRLHGTLFVRAAADGQMFGQDTLDPLLWANTKHLLEGDSYKEALRLLDQFIRERSATLITDPLKRAILQRDLWAVIDWLARRDFEEKKKPAVAALRIRLATIIRQLGLTKQQIAALPDNYSAAVKSGIFPSVFDRCNRELPFDHPVSEGKQQRLNALQMLGCAPERRRPLRNLARWPVGVAGYCWLRQRGFAGESFLCAGWFTTDGRDRTIDQRTSAAVLAP